MVLWEINKIDKPLDHDCEQWTKEEKVQNGNIRNDRYEITTNSKDIKSILKQLYKQNYTNKMENLKESYEFLRKCNYQNSLYKQVTWTSGLDDCPVEFYLSFKDEILKFFTISPRKVKNRDYYLYAA